jgi:hypothetical protein
MGFFDSKFIKDLEQSKLPVVEVELAIKPRTLLELGATAVLVAVCVLFLIKIVKNV